MIKRILLYTLILILSLKANVNPLFGQKSNLEPISIDNYETLKKEVTLEKTKRSIKFPKPKAEEEEEEDIPDLNVPSLGVFGGIFTLLAYACIFILLGLILFLIFNNVDIDKKVVEKEFIPEDEIEDISDIDADQIYDEAIIAGNYRLALRMRFIKILQLLSVEKKIDWKNEKTNRHYLRELSSTSHYQAFRKTATIFEYYWYGNNPLSLQAFDACKPDFESFLTALEK